MKKKIIFAIALLMQVSFSWAQYDPDALAVLDAMSSKYKKVPAFSASFTQVLKNEMAGMDESISGKITVKDNMYKLEIAGQEIYNDGDNIWTFNGEIQEVTVAPNEPEEQEINLNNIYDIYKDGFKYILLSENDNGNRIIDLDPIDRSKSYYKIRMGIDQKDALKFFTVFEGSGNQYTYKIDSFKEESSLDNSFFTFNPDAYPDVEVIDFR